MQSSRTTATGLSVRSFAPAFLAAIVAAGCGSDQGRPAQAPSPDTWATVDGRPIMRDAVEKVFRRAQDPKAKLSPEEAMVAKLSILDELIVQEVLLGKAQALKLEIPQSELDSAFAERRKNMTDSAFDEELKKRNLSPEDMRETLRRELLTNKVIEQEVAAKVSVSDQEVSEFYNANRAQFTLNEDAYRLAQIVVTPQAAQQPMNRTGNDAATPQEASFKVRMIMERLKAGAPFADVAADYSEDPESAPRGGELGLVPVSALKGAPEPLRKAIIGQKPGTVNVVTADGIHTVVAVIAFEPAGERNLDTPGVKDAITQGLKNRKEQLLRTAYLNAARDDATVVNYAARRVVESNGRPE